VPGSASKQWMLWFELVSGGFQQAQFLLELIFCNCIWGPFCVCAGTSKIYHSCSECMVDCNLSMSLCSVLCVKKYYFFRFYQPKTILPWKLVDLQWTPWKILWWFCCFFFGVLAWVSQQV
jgi:hypothetical protein